LSDSEIRVRPNIALLHAGYDTDLKTGTLIRADLLNFTSLSELWSRPAPA